MQTNYKPLGEYIQEVNVRNRNVEITNLIGLSIEKKFIPSISNTIGTDMSTYRIIKHNQFAYCPVTSRNGEKITIALYDSKDIAIISQAYNIFEIIDVKKLLPQYLMMWFRRPEFDRYARFMSHGSVREMFSWEEMCAIHLPVPSLEKQHEIVAEYNVVQKRIDLNNQLIQKFEKTAQAIYKQWFVDFEFPDEEGKPYKSNGGEMVESEKGEMPREWRVTTIQDFCVDMKSGGTPSRNDMDYWNSKDIPWLKTGEIHNNIVFQAEEFISEKGYKSSSAKILPRDTVLMAMYGVTAGQLGILKFKACTNQACCGMICENTKQSAYLYYRLLQDQEFIKSQSIGGAQENLSKNFIEKLPILKPTDDILNNEIFKIIIDNKEVLTLEISKLERLLELLLSKMAKRE